MSGWTRKNFMIDKIAAFLHTWKKILLTTTVMVLIGIAVTYYWWGTRYKRAINEVLEQDCIAYDTSTSKADYVRKMRTIDLDGCPEDFKEAFREHIRAHDVSDTANNISLGALIIGTIASVVTANPVPLIASIGVAGMNTAVGSHDIGSTFDRVKQVAASYGAYPPEH